MYFCAVFGSVAELNRASDSGSEGRGFESHPGHEGKEVSLIEKSRGLF